MSASPPTFKDIQSLIFTLADAWDPNIRMGIYGRHNVTGGFSWETEEEFLNSVIIAPPSADRPLVAERDYAKLTDDQIKGQINGETTCWLITMLNTGRMPPLDPSTKRRSATPAEITQIIAWLRTLPYPRK